MPAPLYIALVHHPVVNKQGMEVTTSITNFDLHDLARTSKTYGVQKCFIITPNPVQQEMVSYIKRYWCEGTGSQYNPDRKEALECLEMVGSIEETRLTIKKSHGSQPRLVATTARESKKSIRFNRLRDLLSESNNPFLILFGTGWGLAPSVFEKVEWVLEPIYGGGTYNHLPVRAAVAVVLDRLMAQEYKSKQEARNRKQEIYQP